ncbi:TetR/AcrR family transcriptional regulator [Phenylobacterium montanum]|uniref:TetR/AcrR family transcriptional regulator n=1 Tax=Phenylobacterium montanum TaxID=2823693 RepID=A0A975G4D3_9CAUL|nr:TetR/AcrR family transcriptional regulator [Caulobacter sp. S6]QUD90353.1 TetR/AcrR family transcriptional regulator [Caulobacter sp. S6]
MRVKTDARRKAITDSAWQVFKENGFERTTMSEISDRVGGSKATLYSYFKSKEELFTAALQQAMASRSDEAFEHLTGAGDLRERLIAFGRGYLEARLTPDMVGVERALMTEAERSGLGDVFRAQAIVPHWRRLAAAFEQEMAAGRLRRAAPYTVALHYRGLVEADILERRLHGDTTITAGQIDAAVKDGVEAFLRAYAP